MKAYGVVRRPDPALKTIELMIPLQKPNPKVAIDPIQQNETTQIRRATYQPPVHSIVRQALHFSVDDNSKNLSITSASLERKHRIFDPFPTSLSKSKNIPEENSKILSPSKPEQTEAKETEVAALPLISAMLAKKSSSREERERLRAASISGTPDRSPTVIEPRDTPLAKLNQTRVDRPKSSSHYYRPHKLFEKRQFSQDLKLQSRQRPQKLKVPAMPVPPINRRSQPPSNNSQVLAQNPLYPVQNNISYDPSRSHALSSSSISEVNIGCCGQQLSSGTKSDFKDRTSYSRNGPVHDSAQMNNQIPQKIVYNRVIQGFADAAKERESINSQKPFVNRIFTEYSPDLQSNKIREEYDSKQDKVTSKSFMSIRQSQKSPKRQLKVTVYEIRSFEPFQF